MDVKGAERLVRMYYEKLEHNEEEEFIFLEALRFLMAYTKDGQYMLEMGNYYYEKQEFELALKYYNLAAMYGCEDAYGSLDYMYYCGQTGLVDYEKAYSCFSKCASMKDIVSSHKWTDMYKNEYSVKKEVSKYRAMTTNLEYSVKNIRDVFDPLLEVYTRLARIKLEEGEISKGIYYYVVAKNCLGKRLMYRTSVRDLNSMKRLVQNLYRYKELNYETLDLYDLYQVLLKPCFVQFKYNQHTYSIQAIQRKSKTHIYFLNRCYSNVDEFFYSAKIQAKAISSLYQQVTGVEVRRNER